jgi:hypothetical protein
VREETHSIAHILDCMPVFEFKECDYDGYIAAASDVQIWTKWTSQDALSPAMSVKECRSISISLPDSVPEWIWTSRTSPPRSPRALRTLATSAPSTRFGCIRDNSGKGAVDLPAHPIEGGGG